MPALCSSMHFHAALLPACTAQVPPMPAEQAREVIERELGVPLEAVFEWIDLDTPLGSASISQVGPELPLPRRGIVTVAS